MEKHVSSACWWQQGQGQGLLTSSGKGDNS